MPSRRTSLVLLGIAVLGCGAAPSGVPFVPDGAATVGVPPAPASSSDAAAAVHPPGQALDGGAADLGAAPGAGEIEGADAGLSEGGPPANLSFTCNLILGTNQTAEWFDAGFEKLVDGSKWELMHAHSAFIELWANASDAVWSLPIGSRCTQNATTPDRVILLALAGGPNGGLSMYPLEKWLPLLAAAVKNIQSHYPSVRRIELMSYVRGPMNGTCPGAPDYRTMVFPSQDQAMAMIAAANPGLVAVAPRWEARSCADFAGNPPHSNAQGAMAWARMIADHYGLGQ